MTTKLPKRFKAKWIAALRSGKYEQGYGQLYNGDINTYCCLGIACVITGNIPDSESFIQDYHNKNGKIPKLLVDNSSNGIGYITIPDKLAIFNDGKAGSKPNRKSFNWIASWIERYL